MFVTFTKTITEYNSNTKLAKNKSQCDVLIAGTQIGRGNIG